MGSSMIGFSLTDAQLLALVAATIIGQSKKAKPKDEEIVNGVDAAHRIVQRVADTS